MSRLYIVYPAYLTFMQKGHHENVRNKSCEMSGWMKHKLESRLLGEISITSYIQMTLCWWQKATVKVKVIQSCPSLYNPMNDTVHGILQARILQWVTVPFSRITSQPRDRTQDSLITGVFFTSWVTKKPKTKSKEELKSLLMKVKEESEKAGF